MANLIKYTSPSYDSDANAFIVAANLTSITQTIVINDLVVNLKGYDLWDKCTAIYPMIGGTASSHKWNLKNPVDSDAAYRLIFSGTWIHSSTGAQPNGTDAYANTFLTASTQLSSTSNHMAFYSRTQSVDAGALVEDMGCNTTTSYFLFAISRITGNIGFYENNGAAVTYPSSGKIKTGFFVGTRTSTGTANIFMYRNGFYIPGATTVADGGLSNLPAISVYIGALNAGGPFFYSNRECAYASIGSGLTPTDIVNYNNIIQVYQGALNRKI